MCRRRTAQNPSARAAPGHVPPASADPAPHDSLILSYTLAAAHIHLLLLLPAAAAAVIAAAAAAAAAVLLLLPQPMLPLTSLLATSTWGGMTRCGCDMDFLAAPRAGRTARRASVSTTVKRVARPPCQASICPPPRRRPQRA